MIVKLRINGTLGQAGDVVEIDPEAEPLLAATAESWIKGGYAAEVKPKGKSKSTSKESTDG